MRKKDLELLWHFTLRTSMYTGIENEGTISAFLHGYEAGTENQCKFIERLSNSIEAEYKVKSLSTGWNGQIGKVAEKLGTEWVVVFKRQSLKILFAEFDDTAQAALTDSFKSRFIGKLERVDDYFDKDWLIGWFAICDLSANWFTEIWTEKALGIIETIETELKTYGSVRELPHNIQPTEGLKVACKKLLKEIRS